MHRPTEGCPFDTRPSKPLARMNVEHCKNSMEASNLVAYIIRYDVSLEQMAQGDSPEVRANALTQLYARLPSVDFSHVVAQGAEPECRVITSRRCGWSNLGTALRVAAVMRRLQLTEQCAKNTRARASDLTTGGTDTGQVRTVMSNATLADWLENNHSVDRAVCYVEGENVERRLPSGGKW